MKCVLARLRIFVRESKPLTRSLHHKKDMQQDRCKKTEDAEDGEGSKKIFRTEKEALFFLRM